MASRGIWPWVLTVAAGVGVGLLLLALTGDESSEPEAVEPQPSSGAIETRPSAFAREALSARQLELYLSTGRDLGLDWSVLAAVDQIEGAVGPADESERVSAIGYSLEALGAPDDYRLALQARGGAPGYEREVLRLADRYRAVGGPKPEPAAGSLRLPVRGPVIAGYGQRLGVLHDGIDIDARTGTPIRAPAPGLVVSTGTHSIFGQHTCLLHRFDPPLLRNGRITTCYGNQSRYAVTPGDVVQAGTVIGYVGCTGTCLRPHVHFQVRLGNGQTAPVTDPAPFLASVPREVGGGRPLEAPAP